MLNLLAAIGILSAPRIGAQTEFASVNWNRSRSTCTVSRYRPGRNWSVARTDLKRVELPIGEPELMAASRTTIAVTCRQGGKSRVLLVGPSRKETFLPRPDGLFGLTFAPDGKTLALLSRTTSGFSVDWVGPSGAATHVLGWFVGWQGARPIVFDGDWLIVGRRGASLPEDRLSRLKLLLAGRRQATAGGFRQAGESLPYANGMQRLSYAISADLQIMFEEHVRWLGPPNGGAPRVDASDDFVEDAVFTAKRVLWRIRRSSVQPPLGFRFVGPENAFEFAMNTSFRMGTKKLRPYPPGLYRVTPNGHVLKEPMPQVLKADMSPAWTDAVLVTP